MAFHLGHHRASELAFQLLLWVSGNLPFTLWPELFFHDVELTMPLTVPGRGKSLHWLPAPGPEGVVFYLNSFIVNKYGKEHRTNVQLNTLGTHCHERRQNLISRPIPCAPQNRTASSPTPPHPTSGELPISAFMVGIHLFLLFNHMSLTTVVQLCLFGFLFTCLLVLL